MMKKIKGLLVVNNFINQSKFTDLYSLLSAAAEKYGMDMKIKKTGELVRYAGERLEEQTDFVLFWDKDIVCAAFLEKEGIPVFNSPRAIAMCDNKAYTALALSGVTGITTPKTVASPKTFEAFGYNDTEFVIKAIELLGLPVVIKECYGSYGQQVYLAHTTDEAIETVKGLGHSEFIMQEFVKTSIGRDVRINVVGDEAVVSMLRYSVNGDFRSNISAGGKMEPYEPEQKMKEMAIRATKILGLDFAGVDVMFGENDEPVICEVNSNPHFRSTLDCTGTDISEHIIRYIKRVLCEEDG